MFSFFKKKPPPPPPGPPAVDLRTLPPAPAPVQAPAPLPAPAASPVAAPAPRPGPPAPAPAAPPVWAPPGVDIRTLRPPPAPVPAPAPRPAVVPQVPAAPAASAFTATPPAAPVAPPRPGPAPAPAGAPPVYADLRGAMANIDAPMERTEWVSKLSQGLRKTGSSIAMVFSGTKIDDALYEELESALLMADAGVKATQWLLDDLKRRVKEAGVTEPSAVKALLADAITALLQPLERPLVIGEATPTVMMVVGVNGAGKTTSIGKLTRHLADADQKVLLAAADTFRAAAREQLTVWAGRNRVEVVSQEGGDPAAVTFDAVVAGRARECDVVIADTAGRLPTQLHLMEELKKIRRVIAKAQPDAPHEVLLVVDGNTGQNALAQVKAFDEALQVSGLIITKLDGTAKGGVLAAIALWARERSAKQPALRPLVVYFIGVGEQLADLETFNAREFAQALLN
ncbi:signal recognition particle-docking protein FtsY [Aquincola sp. J276]|uniref:signal recognition particle-docking protein FtsY n=1 Tax=Aquincola sp. J276 TaxID=2898432 RepID=UPI0021509926|nr:signal recognition particle-docking protein FtsY [Aquincola sp. J276]MCR5866865.1 signal recognition particle-docking protein FtsY [Aquincola sp. J276]